jgi:hypothetical protein
MAVNINVPSQVRTFANLAAFPASGAVKTIYIAEDTNKTYRWDGSTYVEISASAATGLTIGTTPIASGTIGRVLFQGTGNVLQQSSSLFWDGTNNRLGIGTSTPISAMQIVGSTNVEGLLNITNNTTLNFANAVNILFPNTVNGNQVAGFYIGKALSSKNGWGVSYTHSSDGSNSNRGSIDFFGVNSILNWFASGNVAINTTTDAGFRLDVNGTARVSGLTTLSGTMTASGAIARNQLINGTLVAAANNDTLVGLDINSTFTNGAFTGVSNLLLRASIAGTTKASITKDGDIILNGVTGANSPAISVFTSGTSAYFQNYYNPTDNALYWQSVGSYHNTTKMVFRNFQQNTGLAIFSTGNAVFGGNPATVTDAGFRLDVNGTARVSGNSIISLNQTSTTELGISNTTSSAGSSVQLLYTSDANSGVSAVGKFSTSRTPTKIIQGKDAYFYNGTTGGDIALLNDFATGQIKFAAGGSSTAHMTIKSNGRINMSALPTSATGLSAGDIWNDGGTLKIV